MALSHNAPETQRNRHGRQVDNLQRRKATGLLEWRQGEGKGSTLGTTEGKGSVYSSENSGVSCAVRTLLFKFLLNRNWTIKGVFGAFGVLSLRGKKVTGWSTFKFKPVKGPGIRDVHMHTHVLKLSAFSLTDKKNHCSSEAFHFNPLHRPHSWR